MANYLKKDILCEAYTHLDIGLYENKEELDKLKRNMQNFLEERARFLFGDEVTVQVSFEEGSLKTTLTVLGAVSTVLAVTAGVLGHANDIVDNGTNLVQNISEFRGAVKHLSQDSTNLAQSANLELIFRTKTAYCNRVYVEKRRGIFGRVDEYLTTLESIKKQLILSELPRTNTKLDEFNRITESLIDLDGKLNKFFTKTDNFETEACISAGILEEMDNSIPTTVPWKKEVTSNSLKSRIAISDPKFAGEVAGSVARYEETVKQIKANMLERVKNHAPKDA